MDNETIYFQANDIFKDSFLEFTVLASEDTIPGLKCSIYYQGDVYNTESDSKLYWSIKEVFNQPNMSTII